MDWFVVIFVVVYLLMTLGVGVYSSKKIKNTSDYLVAGRQLGPWLVAGSLAATGLDGGATLGVVSNTYGKWGAAAIWYPLSIGLAFFVLYFLAPRLWRTQEKTVPEYFRLRYGKTAGFLASALSIVSVVGLTAGQLKVSASILEVMLGMDYNTALILVAVVISAYAILGGLWSVVLTDCVQFFFILIGMGAAIPFALRLAGGWSAVREAVPAEMLSLTAGIGGWGQILGYLLLFVTSFAVGEEVMPCYYAAMDEKTGKRGSLLAGAGVCVYAGIPVMLGIIIQALYNQGTLSSSVMAAMEQSGRYALPALAVTSIPSVIVAVLFAGILSATMSSADSALLGAGSVYSNDIYKVYICPEADSRKVVAAARISMVFVMIFSFITAIYGGEVFSLVAASLALRAVGAFVPYVLGHFWKGASRAGCLVSLVAGTGAYLITVTNVVSLPMINALLPALAISVLCFFFFSWLLPDKEKKETNKDN
ncbi:MAG: sodium:solute symporter family protein [Lachnospiraceae bacterium]|nr:sodium:solute symporter family protein [Lachnospiraceae bacterium]